MKEQKLDQERIKKNIEEMPTIKLDGHMKSAELMSHFKKRGIIKGGGWDLYWQSENKGKVDFLAILKSGEKLEDYYIK